MSLLGRNRKAIYTGLYLLYHCGFFTWPRALHTAVSWGKAVLQNLSTGSAWVDGGYWVVEKRCWVLICNLTNAQWLSGDWIMSMGKHYPTFQVGINFKHLVGSVLAVSEALDFKEQPYLPWERSQVTQRQYLWSLTPQQGSLCQTLSISNNTHFMRLLF